MKASIHNTGTLPTIGAHLQAGKEHHQRHCPTAHWEAIHDSLLQGQPASGIASSPQLTLNTCTSVITPDAHTKMSATPWIYPPVPRHPWKNHIIWRLLSWKKLDKLCLIMLTLSLFVYIVFFLGLGHNLHRLRSGRAWFSGPDRSSKWDNCSFACSRFYWLSAEYIFVYRGILFISTRVCALTIKLILISATVCACSNKMSLQPLCPVLLSDFLSHSCSITST